MYKNNNIQGVMVAVFMSLLLICHYSIAAENQVDINHASLQELKRLKYAGETIAKRIIEYREKMDGLKSTESIRGNKGFGSKAWEANKDRIIITPYKKSND